MMNGRDHADQVAEAKRVDEVEDKLEDEDDEEDGAVEGAVVLEGFVARPEPAEVGGGSEED